MVIHFGRHSLPDWDKSDLVQANESFKKHIINVLHLSATGMLLKSVVHMIVEAVKARSSFVHFVMKSRGLCLIPLERLIR